MLKFLRKYNKWILVIGGSLLMIAFLVPQGIQQMGSHKKGPAVARLGDRKVRQLEFHQASAELQMLSGLLRQPNVMGVEPRNEAAHWILLAHAAEQAGLYGGEGEGRNLFEQVARGMSVEQVAGSFRLQPSEVYEGLARAAAVFRLRSAHDFAAVLSDRKAAAAAKRMGDEALIDLVFIPGSRADEGAPPPDEAALLEQFNGFEWETLESAPPDATFTGEAAPPNPAHDDIWKDTSQNPPVFKKARRYRDVRKGGGEFGFGYLLDPRLKLEWLRFDRAAIERAVVLDPVDVNKRWRTNRERFKGDFESERAAVEAEVRSEVADRAMQAAHDAIRAEVYNATKGLPADGKYKRVPAGWSPPRWESIAAAVVARVNEAQNPESSRVVMPLPQVVVREAAWSTLDDLYGDPELSMAMVRVGQQQAPLAAVLTQTREINPSPQITLQVGIPAVDFFATRGQDRIYFTITDARKESPPDTLDEVREQVTADVRAMRGLIMLTADVDLYRDMAAEGGLRSVVDYFTRSRPPGTVNPDETPLEVRERVVISPLYGGNLPADDPDFRKAVLSRAGLLDPLSPVDQVPFPDRTHAIVTKRNLGLVVFTVRDLEPLTIEKFRISGGAVQQALQEEFRDAGRSQDPFSYRTLADRYRWSYIGGEAPEDQEPGDEGSARAAGR